MGALPNSFQKNELENRNKRKAKEEGRPFVAEVARIAAVNRNYGPVITAAGRYVFTENYFALYYIGYIA